MPARDTLVTPADQINPMLTAADIMTPSPRTCSPHGTVLEAVLIFRDADCGAVPIVDDGKPVGMLTDRDIALALARHGDTLANRAVADLMTRDVLTVSPDAPLDVVQERFGERGGVRRLLVADTDGRLLGIIAWSDLAPHVSPRGWARWSGIRPSRGERWFGLEAYRAIRRCMHRPGTVSGERNHRAPPEGRSLRAPAARL